MKKNIFRSVAIAATATLMLASCDQSTPKMDAKAETPATPSDLKIAYVEVDSIMSQYKFCKDYSLILQKKGRLEEQYSKMIINYFNNYLHIIQMKEKNQYLILLNFPMQ